MKKHNAYLLFLDNFDQWSISRTFSFETAREAQVFCQGMNEGLDKGRCAFHKAVTESEFQASTNSKEYHQLLRERCNALGISMIYEYINEEMTSFELPDYRISEILRVIEAKLEAANERCKGQDS